MTSQNTVNRSLTTHANLFVAHGAKARSVQAPFGGPLPLPEVTYVDWSEWERVSSAGHEGKQSTKPGVKAWLPTL